jgi:hypothetical protein
MRTGWPARFSKCIATDRGDVYLAELAGDTVDLGRTYVIETTYKDDGWFDEEGSIRWTRGSASIGLDQTKIALKIEPTLHNFLSTERLVELVVCDETLAVNLLPGEIRKVSMALPMAYDALRIVCEPSRIADVVPVSEDDRVVGIAVSTIVYLV